MSAINPPLTTEASTRTVVNANRTSTSCRALQISALVVALLAAAVASYAICLSAGLVWGIVSAASFTIIGLGAYYWISRKCEQSSVGDEEPEIDEIDDTEIARKAEEERKAAELETALKTYAQEQTPKHQQYLLVAVKQVDAEIEVLNQNLAKKQKALARQEKTIKKQSEALAALDKVFTEQSKQAETSAPAKKTKVSPAKQSKEKDVMWKNLEEARISAKVRIDEAKKIVGELNNTIKGIEEGINQKESRRLTLNALMEKITNISNNNFEALHKLFVEIASITSQTEPPPLPTIDLLAAVQEPSTPKASSQPASLESTPQKQTETETKVKFEDEADQLFFNQLKLQICNRHKYKILLLEVIIKKMGLTAAGRWSDFFKHFEMKGYDLKQEAENSFIFTRIKDKKTQSAKLHKHNNWLKGDSKATLALSVDHQFSITFGKVENKRIEINFTGVNLIGSRQLSPVSVKSQLISIVFNKSDLTTSVVRTSAGILEGQVKAGIEERAKEVGYTHSLDTLQIHYPGRPAEESMPSVAWTLA